MRRFKLRRHAYKARNTSPPASGRGRSHPILFSLHDQKFCQAGRQVVLQIGSDGRLPAGGRAQLLSRFSLPKRFRTQFYSVIR